MAMFADDLAGGTPPKAAILLIVGEPFSDGDKQSILEEIVKGFKCWDSAASGVDINDELAQVANRADLGEEGPDDKKSGERIIRHRSENSAIELLINPQSQTVKESLKAILTQLSPAKLIVYAGYTFQGTAAWVVQDDLFSFSTFNQMFKDPSVENAVRQTEGLSMVMHTPSPGEWTAALKGSDVERLTRLTVNPAPSAGAAHGAVQFAAYVGNLLHSAPLGSLLEATDVVGSISFTRPVLYIFPAQQGDSALIGMKGFNMLVDGGYSRRSCFWDFVRHLDGVDALLMTHLGPDNLFGLKALLDRKAEGALHPNIDYMYMNTGKASNHDGGKAGGENGGGPGSSDLVINLAAEGARLVELSQKLGHIPHPLTRPLSGNLEPLTLYHKIGKGSLDMYVLNPVADAKEMKDFLSQWEKKAAGGFSQAGGIPIPNCTSVCALLVVRPASPSEPLTRFLFPGTAPQHKLMEGLERVKHLEFLKHPTFCAQDLHKAKKPPAGSAASSAAGRTGSGNRKPPAASSAASKTANARPESASSSAASRSKAEPPKRLDTKSSASKVSAAPPTPAAGKAGSKTQKDTNNKRASSAREKVKLDEKEKEDKTKSSTSSSPSKASKSSSPVKTPASPVKTPSSPTKSPAKAGSPSKEADKAAPVITPPAPAAAQPEAPPEPVPQDITPSPITPEANHMDQGLPPAADLSQPPPAADLMPLSPASADLLQSAPANVDMMGGDRFQQEQADFSPSPEPAPLGSGLDTSLPPAQQSASPPPALTEQQQRDLGIYNDEDEGVDDGFDDRDMESGFAAQPQSLPEPMAAMEMPSSVEPDLIQDTPACQQSDMERSQLFEQEIEPDYTADAKEAPAEPQDVKEQSPAGSDDLKEYSPAPGEQSYSDREQTPDQEEKEASPALEEPHFADDPVEQQPGHNIAQNIQYGMTHDNGFQMGGIREEEEEEAAAEREDFEGGSQEPVHQEAGDLNKQSMEEMGIYDDDEDEGDEGQYEEEAARHYEKDAYAYENDVNLEDEEIRMEHGQMAHQQPQAEDLAHGFGDHDQQSSNIPEAFERDESPTPMEKQQTGAERGEDADSGQEDTDSIDGGTPDHDKDIDEALAQQQQKQDPLAQLMEGSGEGQNFNPFIGLGAQNQSPGAADEHGDSQAYAFEQEAVDNVHPRGGPEEFDPLAQWGPPTGLPAPCPLQDQPGSEQELQQEMEEEAEQVDSPLQEAGKPAQESLPLDDGANLAQEEDSSENMSVEQESSTHSFGFGVDLLGGTNAAGPGLADSDKGSDADPSEFDPLAEWGQPMGLPAPPPAEPSSKTGASKAGAGDAKKAEARKTGPSPMKGKTTADKRPTSATGKSPAKPTNGTADPPKSARAKPEPKKAGGLDTSRTARPASGKTLDTSRVEAKPRAGSAPTARKPAASSAASKSRSSPDTSGKMPSLPPFTPFYVDLSYIPCHGDTAYLDAEFFKRVRARHYVLSTRCPNPKVLDMLLEAKAGWDKARDHEVTVIPTYETPILQHWLAVNKEKLAESKVVIGPAASRCTVRLQDHHESCYTYRLEF